MLFLSLPVRAAATYGVCKKWVVDGLAVTCQQSFNSKSVGSLIFFKKITDDNWAYHGNNVNHPFDIYLPGPGLFGPHVTSDGYTACELFCQSISIH